MIDSVVRAILLKVAEFMTDEKKRKRFVESINRSHIRSDIDCRDRTL